MIIVSELHEEVIYSTIPFSHAKQSVIFRPTSNFEYGTIFISVYENCLQMGCLHSFSVKLKKTYQSVSIRMQSYML